MPESQDNVAVVEEGDFAGNRLGLEWESMRDATCLFSFSCRQDQQQRSSLVNELARLGHLFLEPRDSNVT